MSSLASSEESASFHSEAIVAPPDEATIHSSLLDTLRGLRISSPLALLFYCCFALLIYWPVFLGHRFFWEDIFVQEYPIRDYSYYMLALKHQLPFWNPYSWAWAPLLADAQNGFWYPGNLLQIGLMKLFAPNAHHLPTLLPTSIEIAHMALAALGVFQLARTEYRLHDVAALLAGLTFGFGLRMVSEQNHPMQIYQLALLPWEFLLLRRAWRDWQYAIYFGLLYGISFLAGQPQTFFFCGIFFGLFTITEVVARYRESHGVAALKPFAPALAGCVIAVGIASIQLLHTLELTPLSTRAKMRYDQVGEGAIHLGHLIDFFVPKFYGENPGFNEPISDLVHSKYWYWEATFYWSLAGEVLALFAAIYLWRRRSLLPEATRHLTFVVWFFFLAIAYGMGHHLHFQWLFYTFVPFFNQLRAPNRMIWFSWFLGSLYAGVGLHLLLGRPMLLITHRKLFLRATCTFLVLSALVVTGALDLLFDPKHYIRTGIGWLNLPALLVSATLTLAIYLWARDRRCVSGLLLLLTLSIPIELYFYDHDWHRNTLSRETVVARDTVLPLIANAMHRTDHASIVTYDTGLRHMHINLGMLVRAPIQFAADTIELHDFNPMRLARILPPVTDSLRRMAIMGVTDLVDRRNAHITIPNPLPFAKLYHSWVVAPGEKACAAVLNDSTFDVHSCIVLESDPHLSRDSVSSATSDTSHFVREETCAISTYNENDLEFRVTQNSAGLLFVGDLYYPAWRCTVDGKDAKILRAFGSLRAVAVPAGSHRVEMRYESAAFEAGWKITLGTAILAAGALLFTRRSRAKRKTLA